MSGPTPALSAELVSGCRTPRTDFDELSPNGSSVHPEPVEGCRIPFAPSSASPLAPRGSHGAPRLRPAPHRLLGLRRRARGLRGRRQLPLHPSGRGTPRRGSLRRRAAGRRVPRRRRPALLGAPAHREAEPQRRGVRRHLAVGGGREGHRPALRGRPVAELARAHRRSALGGERDRCRRHRGRRARDHPPLEGALDEQTPRDPGDRYTSVWTDGRHRVLGGSQCNLDVAIEDLFDACWVPWTRIDDDPASCGRRLAVGGSSLSNLYLAGARGLSRRGVDAGWEAFDAGAHDWNSVCGGAFRRELALADGTLVRALADGGLSETKVPSSLGPTTAMACTSDGGAWVVTVDGGRSGLARCGFGGGCTPGAVDFAARAVVHAAPGLQYVVGDLGGVGITDGGVLRTLSGLPATVVSRFRRDFTGELYAVGSAAFAQRREPEGWRSVVRHRRPESALRRHRLRLCGPRVHLRHARAALPAHRGRGGHGELRQGDERRQRSGRRARRRGALRRADGDGGRARRRRSAPHRLSQACCGRRCARRSRARRS